MLRSPFNSRSWGRKCIFQVVAMLVRSELSEADLEYEENAQDRVYLYIIRSVRIMYNTGSTASSVLVAARDQGPRATIRSQHHSHVLTRTKNQNSCNEYRTRTDFGY